MDTNLQDQLSDLEARLAALDRKPIVYVTTPRKMGKIGRPVRVPLMAETPEKLVEVLQLTPGTSDLSFDAGLLAFAARNPGQAKKMPQEWHEALWKMGASYTINEWMETVRVGELIANHRYVHTPMAPLPYVPPPTSVVPGPLPKQWLMPMEPPKKSGRRKMDLGIGGDQITDLRKSIKNNKND